MTISVSRATPPSVSGNFCFIDGNFLESAIDSLKAVVLPNDDVEIDRSKALPSHMFRHYWYDSLPAKKRSESEMDFQQRVDAKTNLLQEIASYRNVIVRDGYSKWEKRRGQHQKAVDVLLAVDALQHAYNGSMQEFHLLAGDIDFLPVVDALVMNGVRVVLHKLQYGGQVSDELLRSTDHHLDVTVTSLSAVFGDRGRFGFTRMGMSLLDSFTKVDTNLFRKDEIFFLEFGHRDASLIPGFRGEDPEVLKRIAASGIYQR